MLSEDSKLFLRVMFAANDQRVAGGEEPVEGCDELLDAIARGGRETIELSINAFVEQFTLDMKSQEMHKDAANIRTNMQEAIQYVGGILGMA